jgi:hypothetical protein
MSLSFDVVVGGDGLLDVAGPKQVVHVNVVANQRYLVCVNTDLDNGVCDSGAIDLAEIDDRLDAIDDGERELPVPGQPAVVDQ